ncbi:two-component system sensor histidine kinase NtrB [Calderihabitans maritimus]|uniref:histidine kinase n=1 Tax=Calderihabitans maritimus TaxID=1246530 RepID=A0A1Z5HX83_9FIRM|nr:ATP-binding protein [Calderihabitans maritimus]GAW93941.1 histidine kinase [Calderihabitans maritimus]
MLSSNREYNDSIFESLSSGVITTDLEGYITGMNPAAEKIFGVSRREAQGLHYQFIMVKEERERLSRTVNYVLRTGKTYRGRDVEFQVKGNKKLIINPSISLIKNRRGEALGIAMVVEDVTEKRQLERHLRQAEKLAALGEMAVGVAHEIRNPLGAIHGYSNLVLMEMEEDDPRRRYLEIIIKEAERLTRITQQLLDFAKPSSREFKEINLHQLLDEVLAFFQMETSVHEVAVVKIFAEDLPPLIGDEEGLKQVFLNIFFNSLQAISSAQGEIHVVTSYDPEGEWIVVEISDNGVGIAPENLDRIFDPFFTTKEKGTGLGLAIVHRIVSEHGGLIEVESKVGEGTKFWVKMPSKERMVLLGR